MTAAEKKEIRIGIIEDDIGMLALMRIMLQHIGGFSIGFEAPTMESAENAVQQLSSHPVDVVLLDGNISPRASKGSEGKALFDKIRKISPNTKIVWTSSSSFPDEGTGKPDLEIDKTNLRLETLEKSIRNLFLGDRAGV